MYPVTVQHSLLVAFLLSLKGSYIHSAGEICAPVGSTALLSCPHTCSKKYIWTLDGKHINLKSDQNKYSVNKNNCSLTIQNLNKTDNGKYRFCETDDDDDDSDSEEDCKDLCRKTLYVTDLQVNVDVDRVTEGQKVTLTCHTSCPPNTQSFIWLKNTQRLDLQHFRNQLRFDPVRREDTGRYSCALNHSKSLSSAERFLNVSYASRITTVSSVRSLETRAVTLTYTTLTPLPDVMIDSTGIIILSSLLVLLALMMIAAAVWRRRKILRRREGNESQSTNHSLPYTVYENVTAAPSKTFNVKKKEEFDHKNDFQYCYVDFSKNAHRPAPSARVDDVQYAAVKVSARSDAPY